MVSVPLGMPIMNGRGIAWHANQPVPRSCANIRRDLRERERELCRFFFSKAGRKKIRVGRGWGKKAESMMSLSMPNVPGFIFNIKMR